MDDLKKLALSQWTDNNYDVLQTALRHMIEWWEKELENAVQAPTIALAKEELASWRQVSKELTYVYNM